MSAKPVHLFCSCYLLSSSCYIFSSQLVSLPSSRRGSHIKFTHASHHHHHRHELLPSPKLLIEPMIHAGDCQQRCALMRHPLKTDPKALNSRIRRAGNERDRTVYHSDVLVRLETRRRRTMCTRTPEEDVPLTRPRRPTGGTTSGTSEGVFAAGVITENVA